MLLYTLRSGSEGTLWTCCGLKIVCLIQNSCWNLIPIGAVKRVGNHLSMLFRGGTLEGGKEAPVFMSEDGWLSEDREQARQ